MQMSNNHKVEAEVIQFLLRLAPPARSEKPVTSTSEISRDFGIDGADGDDLILAFCSHFGVRPDDWNNEFHGKRFFGPEAGWSPIAWFFTPPHLDRLTVSDLVRCAEKYGHL
jgi:hypothetical protein